MNKFTTYRKVLFLFVFLAIFSVSLGLPQLSKAADEMPVPLELQAALFKKIFGFDKQLKDAEEITVLIAYSTDETPVDLMTTLREEFEKVEINVNPVKTSKLVTEIGNGQVVYVMPGVDADVVNEITTDNSVLSISGLPELVETGKVSVAVGVESGKPKIMVNMTQTEAEGHEFSAQILKLAKVIK